MAVTVPRPILVPQQDVNRRPATRGPQVIASYPGGTFGGSVVLVEEQPKVRTIGWADGSHNRLAFPFCVWVVHISGQTFFDAALYFRRTALPRDNPWAARLDAPCCWNLYEDRTICFGRTEADKEIFLGALVGHTDKENARLLSQQWWRSAHNQELPAWVVRARNLDPRLTSIETWEKATKYRAGFVLQVDWSGNGSWTAAHARRQLTG